MQEPTKKIVIDGQEYSVFNSNADYNLQIYGCEDVNIYCFLKLKANAKYSGTITALCEDCKNPYLTVTLKHKQGQEDIAIFNVFFESCRGIIEHAFKQAGLKKHVDAIEKKVKILTNKSGELRELLIIKGDEVK